MSELIDINLLKDYIYTKKISGVTFNKNAVAKLIVDGEVLWTYTGSGGSDISLEVAKFTSNTYDGSTSYSNEEFILLDIYPRSGGTVTVTYGGITQTITDDGTVTEPNAQQVCFGTFNGVAEIIETPASGTLTIEGDCIGFGVGSYNSAKNTTAYCGCITAINSWGNIKKIPANAFRKCTSLKSISFPYSVSGIGNYACYDCASLESIIIPDNIASFAFTMIFTNCTSITSIEVSENHPTYKSINGTLYSKDMHTLIHYPVGRADTYFAIPDSITTIYPEAFYGCVSLTEVVIPEGVSTIGNKAFYNCISLANIVIPASVTSIEEDAFYLNTNSRTVTMLSTTPPTLKWNEGSPAFHLVGYNLITVPAGCGETYKAAAVWVQYADYITEAT